jgi:hypothetical protein
LPVASTFGRFLQFDPSFRNSAILQSCNAMFVIILLHGSPFRGVAVDGAAGRDAHRAQADRARLGVGVVEGSDFAAVELLTSTWHPLAARATTSCCKRTWSPSPKRAVVYDVKFAVRVMGAYGGSQYRKSPGPATSRASSNDPYNSLTRGSASASATACSLLRLTIAGRAYRPAGTLNAPRAFSRNSPLKPVRFK